ADLRIAQALDLTQPDRGALLVGQRIDRRIHGTAKFVAQGEILRRVQLVQGLCRLLDQRGPDPPRRRDSAYSASQASSRDASIYGPRRQMRPDRPIGRAARAFDPKYRRS